MSVASDIAPEVTIPARARRTSASWWPESTVIGNVITPSAFHRPSEDVETAGRALDLRRGETGLRLVPAALQRPVAPASEPAVHLTSRGRLALCLLALAVSFAVVGTAWSSWSASSQPPAAVSAPAQIVVHDGDTLWSIAAVVAPTRDPRQTVDQLRPNQWTELRGACPRSGPPDAVSPTRPGVHRIAAACRPSGCAEFLWAIYVHPLHVVVTMV